MKDWELTDPYEVYLAYRSGISPFYKKSAATLIAANLGKGDGNGNAVSKFRSRAEVEQEIEELNASFREPITMPHGVGDTCEGWRVCHGKS